MAHCSSHLFSKSIRLKICNRLCKISHRPTHPVVGPPIEIRRWDSEFPILQKWRRQLYRVDIPHSVVSADARPARKVSPLTWKPSRAPGTPVAPPATKGRGGVGRVRRGGCRPRVARYDCFAVILYWINGAGNNRARHNARMGRRPCRPGGTRTGFSVRRMRRGGGRRRFGPRRGCDGGRAR